MISGEVMPVIGKWLNYMSRLHDGVDAILIADRHGTIEYSAMFSEQENGLADEGFIGKNILEAYPQLTEETSSHFRVMRTGAPVLNEKQELTDFYGRRTILVSSTFPLEYSGELIGTMETSVFYHKDAQLDGKNHWLANPHKGLFRLDDIITQNPEMLTLKDTVQPVPSMVILTLSRVIFAPLPAQMVIQFHSPVAGVEPIPVITILTSLKVKGAPAAPYPIAIPFFINVIVGFLLSPFAAWITNFLLKNIPSLVASARSSMVAPSSAAFTASSSVA